jgi:hypothetical protein
MGDHPHRPITGVEFNHMNATQWLRLGGWILVANAVIGAFLAFWFLFDLGSSKPLTSLQLIGIGLLLVGLVALAAILQPYGRAGLIGVGLIAVGAAIAFVLLALSLSGNHVSEDVATTSALCGMLGDLIVGAISIRQRLFPIWAGWLLGISGVINFVTGQLDGGTWLRIVAATGALLGAAAIAGYGWTIAQSRWAQSRIRTV